MNMQDRYDAYARHCRVMGWSEADIEAELARMRREDAAIDKLVCPSCGDKLVRHVFARQAGAVSPELGPGGWASYRHAPIPLGQQIKNPGCTWFLDRWEVGAAN